MPKRDVKMGEESIKQPMVGKCKQDGGHKPSLGEGSKQFVCARGLGNYCDRS